MRALESAFLVVTGIATLGCPQSTTPSCTPPTLNSLNLTGSDGTSSAQTTWTRSDSEYVVTFRFQPPSGPVSASYDYTLASSDADAAIVADRGTYEIQSATNLFLYSTTQSQTGLTISPAYDASCVRTSLMLGCSFHSDAGAIYCGPSTAVVGQYERSN